MSERWPVEIEPAEGTCCAQLANDVAMTLAICATCEEVMDNGIRMSISVARTCAACGTVCSGAYRQ